MDAYNHVIKAITQSAQAEAEQAAATMQAVLNANGNAVSPKKSAAEAAERSGFENLISGNYSAALEAFTLAEKIYPDYHNVFEISNALRKALADGKIDANEKQNLLKSIRNNWSWGAPKDLLEKLNTQIK